MHVRTLLETTPVRDVLRYLVDELKIHVVEDESLGLVSLKYNQIESPMDNPIVAECRGMVVDVSQRFGRVLAHPYNKFWNHGEKLAAPIDWSTARVQDKLDGSLMILYFHHGRDEWMVASSGHPTAGGSFGAAEKKFRDAFWDLFAALEMRLPPRDYMRLGKPGYNHLDMRLVTFMFELCDAPNRVVVLHEKPRLVLHGMRDLITLAEVPPLDAAYLAGFFGWEYVQHYGIGSIDACLAAAEALNPIANEGFVVVDADWNRVKIKSPRYVILHHMKGEATPRRAIELWQTGETSELLSHFPEMAPAITPMQTHLDLLAEHAHLAWAMHSELEVQKDFAMAVKHQPWSAVCFQLRKMAGTPAKALTPFDATTIMRGMSLSALERMVEACPP